MSTNDQLTTIQQNLQADLDKQIEIANKYPRDFEQALPMILKMATQSKETAAKCFYAIPRENKKTGKIELTIGESARLAEIFVQNWKNLRISTHITERNENEVKALGIGWDLEKNNAISVEVVRSIRDSNGKMYSNELITQTMMAAQKIAFRNTVFTLIPKSITEGVINRIKMIASDDSGALGFEEKREVLIDVFTKETGIPRQKILEFFSKTSSMELTREDIFTLGCIKTAFEERTISLEDIFGTGNHIQKRLNGSKKGENVKFQTPDDNE